MKSLPTNHQSHSAPPFLSNFKSLLSTIFSNLPLVLVVLIALIIALQNIHPTKTYTGWDNVHGEFDLVDYSKQVIGGAWSEHQGLGAPSAQGQLAEVPRLPWLFILKLVLPTNLIRYAYIFITYTIGGVTMYLYLKKMWFKHQPSWFAAQLAGMGAILYLLHMLTLQQFYIAFEMFMAQFAFLPLLLIVIHRFEKKLTVKTLLIFFAVQFLIAPSAHTPTVFYLGVLVTQIYGFFITLKQGLVKAVWTAFLIGFLSFIANAYFIIPNLYYSFENAHYVAESRDNQLFASESLASVREAATVSNFLRSTHYLFTWRDYSFATKEFTFIFDDWRTHLNNPVVQILLHAIGVITVLGAATLFFNKKLMGKRWAILSVFLVCVLFIWMGMFPFQGFFDWLYTSDSFREAFRNPFTKLSIIYSIVSVIAFASFWEWILGILVKLKPTWLVKTITGLTITLFSGLIVYTALPSFQSHFLSEKLQAEYPPQYQELFSYLKTKSSTDRILALPQTSHAGWEYYDWQFLGEGNGYQGLGFYFFGVKQPVLHRDFDRWGETSDFFYHELKYALDRQDTNYFNQLLAKYQIDLILIDETRFEPTFAHDVGSDHQFAVDAGLTRIWQKDFLSVYQKNNPTADNIYAPETISPISAETSRTRHDFAFQAYKDYLLLEPENQQTSILFPFANTMTKEINNISYDQNNITIEKTVPDGNYDLFLPASSGKNYTTPVSISFSNQKISIAFPKNSLTIGTQTIQLSSIESFNFDVESNPKQIVVFFNQIGFIVSSGETITPILELERNKNVSIEYAIQPTSERVQSQQINTDNLEYVALTELDPNWSQLDQALTIKNISADKIAFTSQLPFQKLDLEQNPSVNCSQPRRGSTETTNQDGKIIYQADDYAVNCNAYNFTYPITSYSQLLLIEGTAEKGRGTKMFLNFDDEQFITEDFLFQDSSFKKVISLPVLSTGTGSQASLNWETRSFGQNSQNSLSSLSLVPFPSDQLAQLQLVKTNKQVTEKNNASIMRSSSFLTSFSKVNVSCSELPCYFALDQSYDKLWLAFNGSGKLLNHFRLNNWANTWQITQTGESTIYIVYLPELLSLASFAGLTLLILILLYAQASRKLPQL